MPKIINQTENFIAYSKRRKLLDSSFTLNEKQSNELEAFFLKSGLTTHNEIRQITIFLIYDLDDYYNRFIKLKNSKCHTKENYQLLYGDILGLEKYNSRGKNLSDTLTSIAPWDDFITRRKRNLLKNIEITDKHISELKEVFENIKSGKISRINDWEGTICLFIKNDFTDYVSRILRLQQLHNGLLEYHVIRLGEVKGLEHYNGLNIKKKKGLGSTLARWLSLGYSESEAELLVAAHQKRAGDARGALPEEQQRKSSVRCIEYWIAKGYSEIEAIKQVKEIQAVGRLDNFIRRYGEILGKQRWLERQEKWLKTMASLDTTRLGVSIIANEMFKDVSSELPDIFYGKKEKIIRTGEKLYRVDCINENNDKIIEFFGDYWHANPEKYDSNFITRTGLSAEQLWEKDKKKISLLEQKGHEVLVIWEKDYRTNKSSIVQKCIEFLK